MTVQPVVTDAIIGVCVWILFYSSKFSFVPRVNVLSNLYYHFDYEIVHLQSGLEHLGGVLHRNRTVVITTPSGLTVLSDFSASVAVGEIDDLLRP